MIKLENLNKIYPKKIHAVKNLNIEINKGEIFALLGPNGAGKTTTLRMICGLCRQSSGEIFINNLTLKKNRKDYIKKIGYVSQNYNIDTDLTGYENLLIHGLLHKINIKKINLRSIDLLKFAGLEEFKNICLSKYSGGMKKKIQIIRAILHEPEIVVLDEPTAGLDPKTRQNIWELLINLKENGCTILFSTHYMHEAQNYADNIAIINKSKIITVNSPGMLIKNLGAWCVEINFDRETMRKYFETKKHAQDYKANNYNSIIIRETNMDDVFLNLIGV